MRPRPLRATYPLKDLIRYRTCRTYPGSSLLFLTREGGGGVGGITRGRTPHGRQKNTKQIARRATYCRMHLKIKGMCFIATLMACSTGWNEDWRRQKPHLWQPVTRNDRQYRTCFVAYVTMFSSKADDNHESGTSAGLNDNLVIPEFADFAFSNGGQDFLIANTRGDCLFDWMGVFNCYFTPLPKLNRNIYLL